MKKTILYILFILFLYLMLFTPPFSSFRDRLSVGNIIAFFAIIFGVFKPNIIRAFISNFKKEYILLINLFGYVLLRTVFGGDTSYVSSHLIGIIYLFLVTPMLLYFAKRIGLSSEEQLIRAFMIVGTVASLISLICLMTPSLQNYVRNNMLRITMDDYLYDADYRGFGIASLLTSNYGYVLGLIAAYGSLFLKDNKFFLFCIPLLLFATIINARTGFVLAVLIMAISVLTKKKVSYGVAIVVLAWFLITYSSSLFELIGLDTKTIEFSMSLFTEINDISSGNSDDSITASNLSNMIVFPPSIIEWIVGSGKSIFHGSSNSDIGWIRQLNYGGIIYIYIYYSFFFVMLGRLRANRFRTTFWVVLLYILLINTKSSIFPGYSSFYLLFIFYAMKILPEYRENNEKKILRNTNKVAMVTPTF